jgi:hypothetical protein
MLGKLLTRLTYANVVSTLCLLLLLGGGVAWAASLPRNSVGDDQIKANAVGASEIRSNAVGAAEIKRNAVGASEVRDGTLTAREFSPGLRLQGPPGQRGDQGVPGQPGAPATRLFAYVNSEGTLAFQSGVAGISHTTVGSYVLTFNRSLAGCAVLTTSGRGVPSSAANVTQGTAGASPTVNDVDPRQVQVSTFDPTNTEADRGFFIAAFC